MTKNIFDFASADLEGFNEAMSTKGWLIYQDVLSPDFVDKINASLPDAYQKRRKIQVKNGIAENMDGTLHHLVEKNLFSLEFLDHHIPALQISHFLEGKYILNSFGAVINVKNTTPYVQNIHRDIRTFTGSLKLMIQMIVLLDDFTLENGATYLLSGSHHNDLPPSAEDFYAHAERAVAKSGSVILFDSNLWHAAGKNHTDNPRRALTMAFTRPFIKQQLDYPRALGYTYGEQLSPELRQVIGYNSRVPADLLEYYQPLAKRMYQAGQG